MLATPGSDGIRGQSALVLTSIGADAAADRRAGRRAPRPAGGAHAGGAARRHRRQPGRRRRLSELADGHHRVQPPGVPRRAVVSAGEEPRPHSPALDAMRPALAGRCRWRSAPRPSREVLRALDMAKAFKLDPIITAARQVEEVTAELKAGQRARDLQPELPDAPRRRWRRMRTNRSACCAIAPTRRRARPRSTRPASCSRSNQAASPSRRTS